MCTVTVIPLARQLIITMNRDEARSRTEGSPLEVSISEDHNCWYPIDSESGGTWAGINSFGIVAVLLNRYQEDNPLASHSRGEIIPIVLATKNLKDLELLAKQLDWFKYKPCDLLVLNQHRWISISWDGLRFKLLSDEYEAPFMRTSSSKDLDKTSQWRLDEFYRFLDSQPSGPNTALDFHLSPCTHNQSLGVYMQRPERHTKSITQVHLSRDKILARYFSQDALTSGPDTNHWDVLWPI